MMRTSLFKFFWEIKTVLPSTSLQCADSPADQQRVVKVYVSILFPKIHVVKITLRFKISAMLKPGIGKC